MSGPKAPILCPTCRHLSPNGKVCYAPATHPFKNGSCRAYEPRADAPRADAPRADEPRADEPSVQSTSEDRR